MAEQLIPRRRERTTGHPVILPGGDLVVPGSREYLTVMGLALRQFGTSVPQLREAARMLLAAAEAAFAREQQRAARASAAGILPVFPAAETVPRSGQQTVTAKQAADLAGVTERRICQLAAAGTITGRHAARRVWELDRDSVISYAHGRNGHGDAGSTAA